MSIEKGDPIKKDLLTKASETVGEKKVSVSKLNIKPVVGKTINYDGEDWVVTAKISLGGEEVKYTLEKKGARGKTISREVGALELLGKNEPVDSLAGEFKKVELVEIKNAVNEYDNKKEDEISEKESKILKISEEMSEINKRFGTRGELIESMKKKGTEDGLDTLLKDQLEDSESYKALELKLNELQNKEGYKIPLQEKPILDPVSELKKRIQDRLEKKQLLELEDAQNDLLIERLEKEIKEKGKDADRIKEITKKLSDTPVWKFWKMPEMWKLFKEKINLEKKTK